MDLRGEGTVYRQKGSRFWWIQYYANGQRFTESSKTENEKEARKVLRRKIGAVESGEISSGSKHAILSLYESLERDYQINQRKDLVNLQSRWTNHLEPFFSGKAVCEISADTVSLYISKRQLAQAANASINRELAILKRMFKLAVKSGRLKVGQQPYIQMLVERNVRKGFLKDAEYQALARETGKIGLWLRAMFEVAYTYGWRKRELTGMKVSQVDIEKREILLNPGETKNDLGRGAPMTDRVLELMKACIAGKKGNDYVFTRGKDERGRKTRTPYIWDFREQWERACAAAGVPGLLFHDLRRTGVRNMRRHGISEKVAMKISGHRTRSVFERYNIIDPSDLADAGQKMNQAAQQLPSEVTHPQMAISFQPNQKPN